MGLSPELAELDRKEWLYVWHHRLKTLGGIAFRGFQATGRGLYPMMGYAPVIWQDTSSERQPNEPF